MIKNESAWSANNFIAEYPLTNQQMFFHCKEPIETCLHTDQGTQGSVNTRSALQVTIDERVPQRNDSANQVRTRNCPCDPR